MMKTIAVAAALAAVLATGDSCGGNGGTQAPAPPVSTAVPQYKVLSHRVVTQTFNIRRYELLVNYPQNQGGARWIPVSYNQLKACPDFSMYPKCAWGK